MAHGYWNRTLRVDLSSGRIWTESLGDEFYRRCLGGRGTIAHYLLSELPKDTDSLSPDNRLIFATGVITGAAIPGAGRHSVGAKSPMNNAYGEAEAGGHWGAELKRTGYDAVVVQGRSEKPVYLLVTEDGAELHEASHLWGKVTGEVEDTLRRQLGDDRIRVAQIGPAGENLVRYACIMNDLNEAAGRTGLGAVMGSKLLKAVVVRGKKNPSVADQPRLREVARWVADTMDEKHYNFHHYGTGAAMKSKHLEGHLIVRNFQDGVMETVDKIDAIAIAEQVRVSMDGCYACSVRCKKRVRLEHPYRVDSRYGGPEYETLGAIGTNLVIDDLPAICKANEMANYYGMDTISLGTTIAWAMECYERGILTEEDTGGLALRFGDGPMLVKLTEMVANREGIGDLLAEGALRAARKLGRDSQRYAVHVKGLEVAMHDPRAMVDMRKNYPTNPTGGDHTGGATQRTNIRNSAGLCIFLNYDDDTVLDILRAVTGWDITAEEVATISQRVLTMTRLYNLREGITREDDRLPDRLHEPIRYGPLSSYALPQGEIQTIVEDYYQSLGWDRQSGVPLSDTLAALGLEAYASDKER